MKDKFPTREDYAKAAAELGVEVAAIRAFAAIEAPRGGFMESGHPTILFERHLFHKYTNGMFATMAPDLSNPVAGGYGSYADQPMRLRRAMSFDREAAQRATSWGLFQILGRWWKECGFESLPAFVTAMHSDVQAHLRAFVTFFPKQNPNALAALRDHAWVTVAEAWNGKDQAKHDYSGRLSALYDQLKAEESNS